MPSTERTGTDPHAAPSEPVPASEALAMAMNLHRAGQLDAARTLYRRILEAAPDHADALNFLGLLERQLGDREEALALFSRAVAAAPRYTSALVNLGNVLFELERYDEAEGCYGRALDVDPDDPRVLNNLGSIRRRQGRTEEAIALFERALELAPGFPLPHENLGDLYMRAGNIPAAHDHVCRAVVLDPTLTKSKMLKGVALMHLGRVEEAREHFLKWCEEEPNNPIPRHHLATTFGGGDEVPARAPDDYVKCTFDNFADTFDTHLAGLQYQAPRHVVEALVSTLAPATEGLDILDAGCGTGLCGPLLRPYARRLVGVDLSPKMLAKARARGIYDACVESELVAFLRAHPASFDVIVSADTLCYFGDLAEFAAAAASASRRGARLVFSLEAAEPGEASGRGFVIRASGRYCHDEAYVRGVLAANGFTVHEVLTRVLRLEIGREVAGLIAVGQRALRGRQ